MAKLAFTKLGLSANKDFKTVEINEQTVEIKQYLPVEEKLELISNVINLSSDDNNFANPVKVQVYTTIGVIESYTNISFTEKQKENIAKLYDLLTGNGLYQQVINNIPDGEINGLLFSIKDTIKSVYEYRNSLMGILDIISSDYSNLNLDATNIQQKLADPNNLSLLKEVLTKLG